MIASTDKTIQDNVIIRLSNVEFFRVGQLQRHAVDFQTNGDIPNSYIKECSIHQSFNKAINIRDSNFISFHSNVVFDIKGSAFSLEDGSEIGNSFKNNLVIMVSLPTISISSEIVTGKIKC
jgi:hypothetical protein